MTQKGQNVGMGPSHPSDLRITVQQDQLHPAGRVVTQNQWGQGQMGGVAGMWLWGMSPGPGEVSLWC